MPGPRVQLAALWSNMKYHIRPPVELSGPLPTTEQGDHDYLKYKLIQLVKYEPSEPVTCVEKVGSCSLTCW